MFRRLFIFIEGPDDTRFFEKVVIPELRDFYDDIADPIEYSTKNNKVLKNYFKSIRGMNRKEGSSVDFIFDCDNDNCPCVSERKLKTKAKHPNLDNDRIVVAVEEIESWYLAGLDNKVLKELKIKHKGDTNKLTKEMFYNSIPENLGSIIDFKTQILNRFQIATAQQNNKSFKYFIDRFLPDKMGLPMGAF